MPRAHLPIAAQRGGSSSAQPGLPKPSCCLETRVTAAPCTQTKPSGMQVDAAGSATRSQEPGGASTAALGCSTAHLSTACRQTLQLLGSNKGPATHRARRAMPTSNAYESPSLNPTRGPFAQGMLNAANPGEDPQLRASSAAAAGGGSGLAAHTARLHHPLPSRQRPAEFGGVCLCVAGPSAFRRAALCLRTVSYVLRSKPHAPIK